MGARIADKTVELEARRDDMRVRAPIGERTSERKRGVVGRVVKPRRRVRSRVYVQPMLVVPSSCCTHHERSSRFLAFHSLT